MLSIEIINSIDWVDTLGIYSPGNKGKVVPGNVVDN